ncbi:hypothetical protein [Dyadobacter sp. LHD-138]|uniref:hypothetical protein n=1 Tax=Dyadobacter sp. LHD-138 TaxID=3071413 RepID=UPI0027DFB1B8|nr:hypothetical protein [Dyadobacter sp. LHD-138]MDQ6477175.1 hypothetical protein [Dyadobacter sp. LHD-138]
MKTKLFIFCACLLSAGLMFVSCKGDEGAVGPAGAKGDAGIKGDAGSANVIYSDWLPMPASATASNANRKNFSFAAPKITQDVFDKGHVYGYVKYSPTGLVPLPYADKYTEANGEVGGSFLSTILVGIGSISFNQDWLTPGTIPSSFADSKKVVGSYTHLRYVIVPGGTPAGRQAAVDYSDYAAVKKYYNLPD